MPRAPLEDVGQDPLASWAPGLPPIAVLPPTVSSIGRIPEDLNNLGYFQGALLAVVVQHLASLEFVGTAVMIAPGLALTATHILTDALDALYDGRSDDVAVVCAGIRDGSIDKWRVVSSAVDTFGNLPAEMRPRGVPLGEPAGPDLAFLSLQLLSAAGHDWSFTQFPLTTRASKPGEEDVTIIGLRFPDVVHEAGEDGAGDLAMNGSLYAATGRVMSVCPWRRDDSRMPWPTIEIDCGSLGGMSGGAVLDQSGHVLGVISSGYGDVVTYATWLIGSLGVSVDVPWPSGLYPQPVRLVDIPDHVMRIEGREAIRVISPQRMVYQPWCKPPPARLDDRSSTVTPFTGPAVFDGNVVAPLNEPAEPATLD